MMKDSKRATHRDNGRDRFRHRDRKNTGHNGSSNSVGNNRDCSSRGVENGIGRHKEQDSDSLRNRSSSLSSSSASLGCRNSYGKADRESGELSSGSEGSEVRKSGARVSPSPLRVKKRKFSPIVWDLEEKFASVSHSVDFGSVRMDQSFSSVDQHNIEQDPSTLQTNEDDDEDNAPTRVLSASRWANDNFDGEDIYYEGNVSRTKKNEEIMEVRGLMLDVGESRAERMNSGRLAKSGSDNENSGNEGKEADNGNVSDANDRMETESLDLVVDEREELDISSDNDESVDIDVDDGARGVDSTEDSPMNSGVSVYRKINMLRECRSVDEFERLNRIDEGTYGVVYRARDKKTGEIVALKKVKMEKEREGFPPTSLREINILLSFHHPSIVDVKEVVVGSNFDSIFMVMEYMDHDLKGLMKTMKQPFSISEVKCLMLQLFQGVKYLHDNWVLHRDLKTSNLLLNNRGDLKICDFGLSRQYGSPLREYTRLVVTLWYRAPELLLGEKLYSTAIDMWSLGCIMAELLAKEPLFPGKTEIDQLDKIYRILGTPNEKIWPGYAKLPGVKCNFVKQPYNRLREKFPKFTATSFSGKPALSDAGFDLLNKLLTYDPEKRITAEDALKHEWLNEFPPPKSKEFMPTFPGQHAKDRMLVMRSPDPLEELRKKEWQQGASLGSARMLA